VAVQAGKVDKIRCLLRLGADARATDLNGNTYFHLAARDGRTEVVDAFIGDVDVTSANNDEDTALHLAAKSGHVDAVKILLQKSKLDARNKYAALACRIFIARRYASAVYAIVCPSVCLSVRHTAKHRIAKTTPYDSPCIPHLYLASPTFGIFLLWKSVEDDDDDPISPRYVKLSWV